MKKLLFSALSIALISTSAIAQIPNYSFENWTNMGSYDVPDQWGTMNNMTSPLSVYTVTKGTPGNPGAAYMKITSKTAGSTVVPGIAVSGVLDSMTMQPKSGFAYSSRPASFTGKWQHMIYGSSQGSITVTLTRWDNSMSARVPVATATQTLSGMAMSWANFSINFTYTDGGNPDTCIIVLKSSGNNPTNNDYLWVDNLGFSGTVAGIENHNSFLNSIAVYPNPSSNQIALDLNLKSPEHTQFQLVDMTGRVVYTQDAGMLSGTTKQTIDVTNFAKGSYLIRIVTESGTETKNVVIE